MSLGNETDTGSGTLEKFPAICSLCGKNTTVPFKPEPGRPVYCKDCVAKIKSGEVKVEKKGTDQIKFDETTFFRPLADLGIEFQQKDKKVEEDDRYPERIEKTTPHNVDKNIPAKIVSQNQPMRPKIFSTIKKVFTPSFANDRVSKPITSSAPKNAGLKEVLDKALLEKAVTPEKIPTPAPISLDALKDKMKTANQVSMPNKDRAASSEDMNKLKNLIQEKVETKKEEAPAPTPAPIPQKPITKEVPEDVLRKILE
jgi:CxxC-x17-CxxC domain-containing protein